ncbi:PQQ-binding-like beta-propeller repeat protein, partial [bacterium]|nr:PQQ-binding-like beta-propeller repeat protein [bacterium]
EDFISKKTSLFIGASLLLLLQVAAFSGEEPRIVAARAGNWPQWRGVSSHGVSSEAGLPTTWGQNENIAWKVALAGMGGSSPIVWGGQVFVTSQIGHAPVRQGSHPRLSRDDRGLSERENPMGGHRAEPRSDGPEVFLVVETFNRTDGSRLWQHRTQATGAFPELHESHNLATPTPATDGEHLYAWFGNGQIVCLDMAGNAVWTRHLGQEYSPFRNRWGHGSSPVLYNDLVIFLCDHRPASYLLALDKRTGEERWKVDRRSGRVSHSTPLVVPGPGGDELVVNSSERIDAYHPATGELLWHAGRLRQTPIPSPVFHDGVIYMSRGYRNSDFLAIRPGGRGDVTDSHLLWRTPGGASYVPSIVHYEGLLYMTNEVGVVTCAEASTGKRVWRQRLGGIFFASPVAGDGKVYMVSETGETFVVRAGHEPQILARNDLGERFIASPAISNGQLFLRSDQTLFCIGAASR